MSSYRRRKRRPKYEESKEESQTDNEMSASDNDDDIQSINLKIVDLREDLKPIVDTALHRPDSTQLQWRPVGRLRANRIRRDKIVTNINRKSLFTFRSRIITDDDSNNIAVTHNNASSATQPTSQRTAKHSRNVNTKTQKHSHFHSYYHNNNSGGTTPIFLKKNLRTVLTRMCQLPHDKLYLSCFADHSRVYTRNATNHRSIANTNNSKRVSTRHNHSSRNGGVTDQRRRQVRLTRPAAVFTGRTTANRLASISKHHALHIMSISSIYKRVAFDFNTNAENHSDSDNSVTATDDCDSQSNTSSVSDTRSISPKIATASSASSTSPRRRTRKTKPQSKLKNRRPKLTVSQSSATPIRRNVPSPILKKNATSRVQRTIAQRQRRRRRPQRGLGSTYLMSNRRSHRLTNKKHH